MNFKIRDVVNESMRVFFECSANYRVFHVNKIQAALEIYQGRVIYQNGVLYNTFESTINQIVERFQGTGSVEIKRVRNMLKCH